MPESDPTVAIPTRDGGELLERTLSALARQTVEHELLVCDSGSTDGSVQLAREHGARVLEISPSQFSHGGTRNLLMREASGARVAFLTQDAEPANERWLERLLGGFELADGRRRSSTGPTARARRRRSGARRTRALVRLALRPTGARGLSGCASRTVDALGVRPSS